MKKELKNIAIYVAIILLLIISWLVDGCNDVRDVFAEDTCNNNPASPYYCGSDFEIHKSYLPLTASSAYGNAAVSGSLVNINTLEPKQGLIVRLAEVYCGDSSQFPSVPPENVVQPDYQASVEGLFCIFVLDVVNSPMGLTDENGKFYIDSVPYTTYGYVPLVMVGDPNSNSVYALFGSNGKKLVVKVVGGLTDIGTFLIDL